MLRFLDRAVDAALVLSLAVISFVLVLQVIMRYVFHAPLPWPEELSQFLLVAISFLGMYRAFRENAHIRIQWLPKKPLKFRLMRVAGLLSVVIFLIYIGYGGYVLSSGAWTQPSTALRIPMAVPYLIIPLTCFIALIAVGVTIWQLMRGEDDSENAEQNKDLVL